MLVSDLSKFRILWAWGSVPAGMIVYCNYAYGIFDYRLTQTFSNGWASAIYGPESDQINKKESYSVN